MPQSINKQFNHNILNNPYQYTRAISFRSVCKADDFLNKLNSKNKTSNISELSKLLDSFHKELCDLYDNLLSKYSKSSSIKMAWLQNYHKQFFYSKITKSGQKKYTFSDLKNIDSFFMDRKEWEKKQEKKQENKQEETNSFFLVRLKNLERIKIFFEDISEQEKHSQSRKSDIADKIKNLLSLQGISYFQSFLDELHVSQEYLDEQIKKLQANIKQIKEKLESLHKQYVSSQSSGIEIAKASLNYYTVNKKPKDYYQDQLERTENELSKKEFSKIKNNKWTFQKNNLTFFEFKSKQEKEWLKRYSKKTLDKDLELQDTLELSLEQTYSMMKAFKAEQKSIFYELASRVPEELTLRNQNNNSSLMNDCQIKSVKNQADEIDYEEKNKNHFLNGYTFKSKDFNSIKELKELFSLFKVDFKGQNENKRKFYEEFINLCKDIKMQKGLKKGREEHSQSLNKKDVEQLAQERGKYLQDSFKKDIKTHETQNSEGKAFFRNYTKFCSHYKRIAQTRGRSIAKKKGLEREKREALQTNYWALIYCNQDKKDLWLIPKEQAQQAKLKIEKYPINSIGNLYSFESLTMRALNKLCFSEQSSFVKGLKESSSELKKLHEDAIQHKTKGKNEEINQKNEKKLNFFKALLKSLYVKETLSLQNFNLKNCYKATSLKDFELALEKACYFVKKISLSEGEKQKFLKDFKVTVLTISSYDLEGRNKTSETRYHTDLWNSFFKNIDSNSETDNKVKGFKVGKIRLNPEIKIRHRTADENMKKFFAKRNFPSKFKNRFLKDQLTTHFTLSINAGKKYEDLAFSKPKELFEKIQAFNHEINTRLDFNRAWKYGIDRGNIELATVCLAKFNSDQDIYKVDEEKTHKPKFPDTKEDIICYALKKYKLTKTELTKTGEKKTKYAIKNLSYFIEDKYLNDEEVFEKKNITCIDLTKAKVIKGKIITNGDIMTYLKLKKAVAKRRLFELFTKHEISPDAKLDWSEYENGNLKDKRPECVLNIKTKEGEKTIYWYCKKYEDILIDPKNNRKYTQESIKHSLSFYLDSLKKPSNSEHTPSIQKINHLRDAITANMVGVICFLQKEYPGFILLEDLDKKIIDKQFFDHNENISRRLENALYNKFQALGLVPPHVKDIISLRENFSKKTESTNKKKSKQTGTKSSKKDEIKQKELTQIGAILFFSGEYTSKDCPYCGDYDKDSAKNQTKEQKEKQKKKQKNLKFEQHRFVCMAKKPCGFDTYYFKSEEDEKVKNCSPPLNKENYKPDFYMFKAIDDPDKAASFNIAKKGLKASS